MAAQRGARRARTNPLIPVEPAPAEVAPSVSEAPICGQCWPDGWPEGGDYASCEHGEWSTTEGFVPRAAAGPDVIPVERQPYSAVLDGVTTDGIPVTVTLRPHQPALVSLTGRTDSAVLMAVTPMTPADIAMAAESSMALTPAPSGYLLRDDPVATVSGPTVSPFKPKPAPAPAEVEPGELDTGDDVMFMPSGG